MAADHSGRRRASVQLRAVLSRRSFTPSLWLLTWGLFGFGQIIDLIRLRGMVEDENLLLEGRRAGALRGGVHAPQPALPRDPAEHLRQQLVVYVFAELGG